MARKKKESTAVAKYTSDRTLMGRDEFTPIKEVDGVTIFVSPRGSFVAEAFGVDISEDNLEKAEERVHRAYMRGQQKKRARIGKPAFLFADEHYRRDGVLAQGFFRGVHAGNGALQWRLPDGSKGSSDYLVLFRPDDERIPTLVDAVMQKRDHEAEVSRLGKIISEITEAQKEVMFADVRKTSYSNRPHIRNDAEAAFKATRSIMRNVWGVDPFPDEPEET